MFSFFKSSKTNFTITNLKTDIHSHLIPGIDDGAKTMEDSLALIRSLMDLGYQKIITTPHIMTEYYPNTPKIIREGLENVRAALEQANIKVEIEAAAEYYVDDKFEDYLSSGGELLPFGDRHILIEQSMLAPAPNLEAVIFQLNTKGYRPIFAHPERYTYYMNGFEQFEQLKAYGCLFQLNLLSLTGYYGKIQQQLALKLLKMDMIDLLGTDLHHHRHAKMLQKMASDKRILKHLNGKTFLNHQF